MRWNYRKRIRLGLLRFHFSKRGLTSVTAKAGRVSTNSNTGRLHVDLPGGLFVESEPLWGKAARRRGPAADRLTVNGQQLKPSVAKVLQALHAAAGKPATREQLAGSTGYAARTITTAANQLAAAGLVAERDPYVYTLTEAGRTVLAAAEPRYSPIPYLAFLALIAMAAYGAHRLGIADDIAAWTGEHW